MKNEMPKLPYEFNALSPVISEQTMNFHYGKHLQNYVNTLANLVKDSDLEGKSVEEIVKQAPLGPIYNNAGQVLNHTLYFTQFKPAWLNLSKRRSEVSTTSSSNSRRQPLHSSAPAGLGFRKTKQANSSSRKSPTATTLCAPDSIRSSASTYGSTLTILISKTAVWITSHHFGISSTGRPLKHASSKKFSEHNNHNIQLH